MTAARHIPVLMLLVAAPALVVEAFGQGFEGGKDCPKIVEVHGRRMLEAGEPENYRVQVVYGARAPVEYYWDFGDGIEAVGNNVVHAFEEPGRYTVTVITRNPLGTDQESIDVLVVEPVMRPVDDTTRVVAVASGAVRGERPARPTATPAQRSGRDAASGLYTWSVATFLEREAAEALEWRYRQEGYPASIVVDEEGSGSPAYRVVVGRYASTQSALAARPTLPPDAVHRWLVTLGKD